MQIKKIELCWITSSDVEKSKSFFTETLGLTLKDYNQDYGWLEVQGTEGGTLLGVGQAQECCSPDKPGSNAVVTLSVDNIEEAKKHLESKGVQVGEIMEVPGHVKMADFKDPDGNKFQLVQKLSQS